MPSCAFSINALKRISFRSAAGLVLIYSVDMSSVLTAAVIKSCPTSEDSKISYKRNEMQNLSACLFMKKIKGCPWIVIAYPVASFYCASSASKVFVATKW